MRSPSSSSVAHPSHHHHHQLPTLRVSGTGKFRRAEFHLLHRAVHRIKLQGLGIARRSYGLLGNAGRLRSMDEGSMDVSSLDDLGSNWEPSMVSSSEGEESDEEMLLTPIDDCEMPVVNKQFISSEDALTVTAQRLAMLGKRHRRNKIGYGFFTNFGLMIFVTLLLGLVDWCAWRIVRLPLDPLYVTRPFFVSAVLVASTGYVLILLLKRFNIFHKEGERISKHDNGKGTPTMGGLYFVPIGAVVSKALAGSSKSEVSGAIAVTLAFAMVGLLDDTLCLIKNHKSGSSRKTKVILEVVIAAWYSCWLDTADITSPYSMYSSLLLS